MTATQRRDLRTGSPPWSRASVAALRVSRATRPFDCDVIVVGAGISGALVADTLISSGRSVRIIDRRGLIMGSTAASTALVQSELDLPLTQLAVAIGSDAAGRAWQRSHSAVAALRARIRTLDVAVAACVRPSLYLAGDVLDAKGLRSEASARSGAGLPSTLLSRGELKQAFGLSRSAAILTPGNVEVDPVRLTAALLASATARGARLHAPNDLTAWHETRSGVEVELDHRLEARCRGLVLCTGYELAHGVDREGHDIVSTWVIATRAQPKRLWPHRALIWEASDPYLYVRTTASGRVICGGEDEPHADDARRDASIPVKSETLSRKLSALLPGLDAQPALAWAGAFGSSPTGLPSIGILPGQSRVLAVLGFGGNGITHSMLAAQLIDGIMESRPDPDAELYSFD